MIVNITHNKPIHFILGMGRSGTTILLNNLNDHPKVHGLPEINFVIFFLHQFQNKKNISISEIELIMKQIEIFALSHPFIGWHFDAFITKSELEKNSRNGTLNYPVLCEIVYSNIIPNNIEKKDSVFFLDKNPSYPIVVDKIGAFFPKARFVFIVRDYRSNVLSLKQSVFIGSPDIAYNAYRWNFFNKRVFNYSKKNKGRVLFIKYEDFILNNSEELDRICLFLGINKDEFEESKTDVSEKISFSDYHFPEKFKDRFNKKYADLNRPINKDRLNSWVTQLSSEEILKCDVICHSLAKQFGYGTLTELSKFQIYSIRIKTSLPFIKAFWHVKKDRLLFFFPVKLKLKRLIKKYESIGFTKK